MYKSATQEKLHSTTLAWLKKDFFQYLVYKKVS